MHNKLSKKKKAEREIVDKILSNEEQCDWHRKRDKIVRHFLKRCKEKEKKPEESRCARNFTIIVETGYQILPQEEGKAVAACVEIQ